MSENEFILKFLYSNVNIKFSFCIKFELYFTKNYAFFLRKFYNDTILIDSKILNLK